MDVKSLPTEAEGFVSLLMIIKILNYAFRK